ncbi:MAG: hypothetical protein KGN39_04295, partial [Betaproteobacteria bacterium]|nr:hypothetical protein [Betaproteobacteria bacterium]
KQKELAIEIGRTEQTVTLWEKDSPVEARQTRIPGGSAFLIKYLILNHYLPDLSISACRAHIALPRSAKLVMTRRDGRWLSTRDCIGKVVVSSQWCSEGENEKLWARDPASTVPVGIHPIGMYTNMSTPSAVSRHFKQFLTAPSQESLEWKQ